MLWCGWNAEPGVGCANTVTAIPSTHFDEISRKATHHAEYYCASQTTGCWLLLLLLLLSCCRLAYYLQIEKKPNYQQNYDDWWMTHPQKWWHFRNEQMGECTFYTTKLIGLIMRYAPLRFPLEIKTQKRKKIDQQFKQKRKENTIEGQPAKKKQHKQNVNKEN